MDAANVGERKIATVVDVDIEVQVVWPDEAQDAVALHRDFNAKESAKIIAELKKNGVPVV